MEQKGDILSRRQNDISSRASISVKYTEGQMNTSEGDSSKYKEAITDESQNNNDDRSDSDMDVSYEEETICQLDGCDDLSIYKHQDEVCDGVLSIGSYTSCRDRHTRSSFNLGLSKLSPVNYHSFINIASRSESESTMEGNHNNINNLIASRNSHVDLSINSAITETAKTLTDQPQFNVQSTPRKILLLMMPDKELQSPNGKFTQYDYKGFDDDSDCYVTNN